MEMWVSDLAKSYPKFKFMNRLPNGDYLTMSVWPGKKDPKAEVLTVQIRRLEGGEWVTMGRLAVYRSSDGSYSQLPERLPQVKEPGVEYPSEELEDERT
ncbi:MAG: hypothetical protein QXO32_03090 [Candidatus Bathyarchaeia archaeon]